jgi:hypothetical protein
VRTTDVEAAIRDLQKLHDWAEGQRERLQDVIALSHVADSVLDSRMSKQDLHEQARRVKSNRTAGVVRSQ